MATCLITRNLKRRTLTHVIATVDLERHKRPHYENLIRAGAAVFRVNLSDLAPLDARARRAKQKEAWARGLRELWEAGRGMGAHIAIMADTCGPEFRINLRGDQPAIEIPAGSKVILWITKGEEAIEKKDVWTIPVSGPHRFEGFRTPGLGRTVLVDDGALVLDVDEWSLHKVHCRTRNRHPIAAYQRVTFPETRIRAKVHSKRDIDDLGFLLNVPVLNLENERIPIDFVAQSFVRKARDIHYLRNRLEQIREDNVPRIVAKIETTDAVKNRGSIIKKADAVIVARRDLVAQVERHEVPQIQREIIRKAHAEQKPVVLATGVYAGMKKREHPATRAEVEDVRSALEWGVDALLLADETASRRDPSVVVTALMKQIVSDEKHLIDEGHFQLWRAKARSEFDDEYREYLRKEDRDPEDWPDYMTTDMALAAVSLVDAGRGTGIFTQTKTGKTALEMARFFPSAPIFAMTREPQIARPLLLHRGVHPVVFTIGSREEREFGVRKVKLLVWKIMEKLEVCNTGDDYVIATLGHPIMKARGTNTLVSTSTWERDEAGPAGRDAVKVKPPGRNFGLDA